MDTPVFNFHEMCIPNRRTHIQISELLSGPLLPNPTQDPSTENYLQKHIGAYMKSLSKHLARPKMRQNSHLTVKL